jgi:hypothetical protein
MIDSGYIMIPRRIFEDPLLQDDAYFCALEIPPRDSHQRSHNRNR